MLTINSVKNRDVIKAKLKLQLPENVRDVIKCKNPRCITSIEQNISHSFYLVDEEKGEYRCEFCDEMHTLR